MIKLLVLSFFLMGNSLIKRAHTDVGNVISSRTFQVKTWTEEELKSFVRKGKMIDVDDLRRSIGIRNEETVSVYLMVKGWIIIKSYPYTFAYPGNQPPTKE